MKLEEIGKKTFLDKGQYGKCYILENGKVLKLYNTPKILSEINKFKYFLQYKNNSFLFPIDFVYDKELFHGYICNKSMGNNIKKVFSKIKFNKLAKTAKTLEKDINFISDGKILIDDFNPSNVLYDNKKIEVIDYDFYNIRNDLDKNKLKKHNLEELRGLISTLFIDELITNEETRTIVDKIIECENSDNNIDEMIFEIKNVIGSHYKENINSIEELNEILRR